MALLFFAGGAEAAFAGGRTAVMKFGESFGVGGEGAASGGITGVDLEDGELGLEGGEVLALAEKAGGFFAFSGDGVGEEFLKERAGFGLSRGVGRDRAEGVCGLAPELALDGFFGVEEEGLAFFFGVEGAFDLAGLFFLLVGRGGCEDLVDFAPCVLPAGGEDIGFGLLEEGLESEGGRGFGGGWGGTTFVGAFVGLIGGGTSEEEEDTKTEAEDGGERGEGGEEKGRSSRVEKGAIGCEVGAGGQGRVGVGPL